MTSEVKTDSLSAIEKHSFTTRILDLRNEYAEVARKTAAAYANQGLDIIHGGAKAIRFSREADRKIEKAVRDEYSDPRYRHLVYIAIESQGTLFVDQLKRELITIILSSSESDGGSGEAK